MEKGRKLFITAVCAFVVLAVISSSLLAADKPVTIKGTVEVAAKDDAGKITAIQLLVGNEAYKVADNAKAKELVLLVGEMVEATGMVMAKADGSKMIAIESFKVVE